MSALRELLYKYQHLYAGMSDDSKSILSVKGKWFEKICLYFLRHDMGYKDQFEDVWLWKDWPERNNKPDTGIDIVAKFRDSDKFCAVQCKFYEPEYSVSKPDIDTFLAASSKEIYSQRIIISTSANWNENAEDTIQNQNPPCIRLGIKNLEQSSIDWSRFNIEDLEAVSYAPPKTLRSDQKEAVEAVLNGFKEQDRGKMIMACGTGKTFVSLKVAEKFAGAGKKVLFLVPSIALLNQTLLAWNADRDKNSQMIFFAVCSDKTVGKKDDEDLSLTDLAYPATTRYDDLIASWNFIPDERKENSMTVIFSTYQSLKVINEIQSAGFPDFDLIICDEAHRTTGATLKDKEDSDFVKIHDNNFIHADKRLYMTATPRVFSAALFRKANEAGAVLASMDDEKLFGVEFYRLSFSEAVKRNLLSDYKVMILAVPEKFAARVANNSDGEIPLSDGAKILGCWKGLSKQIHSVDYEFIASDPQPMHTAVAFTNTIKNSKGFKENFKSISEKFDIETKKNFISCEVHHVDGKMPMTERVKEIEWLKDGNENSCKILSNAKCLSEGVDVPALDAILFLNPKKSEIEIIQSVGRVMRKAPGKKFGYVIVPVVVSEGLSPEEALTKSESYETVMKVLQALRSHDDKFNSIINSLEFNKKSGKVITDVFVEGDFLGGNGDNEQEPFGTIDMFPIEEWRDAVYVRIIEKCGDREYWDKWARDMAKIAQAHSARVKELLKTDDELVNDIFEKFITGLRENVNNSITEDEAIGMLSQHMITKPIFDACFKGFSEQNPVSITISEALNFLEMAGLKKETESLQKFYESVNERFSEVKTDEGRQKIIKDLYERFFQTAFPLTAQRLGIVYTPNEVVDFILRSADWALKNELEIPDGLSAENVHILDPFTGTGTFIVRLLQLGLISPEKLEYKYKNEIHAQEILMLAYYIAAVNIEMAFHTVKPDADYEPFAGIIFTDTFNETRERQLGIFQENLARTDKLRDTPITVIIGNPPYSVGQKSANDNNQRLKYEALDERIKETYTARSQATNKNSLSDSYIRAIRWASDRIKERGIICFVTNGAFLDSNSADGLRKCLCDEFDIIYVFNLRGNANSSGEFRRREAGNIFGSGSKLPVAITLLVKKGMPIKKKGQVLYHNIGDYLKREEKLSSIQREFSFGQMKANGKLTEIIPNDSGDWINQRNEIFDSFMRLGNKKESENFAIFEERYSRGIVTGRDAWCYNFSKNALKTNMTSMIKVYNQERERWHKNGKGDFIQDFVTMDAKKISWTGTLLNYANKDKEFTFSEASIRCGLYRPFTRNNVYFDRYLNEANYHMPSIFPTAESRNLVIGVLGIGSKKDFSVLMTDTLPCLDFLDKSQCFPLYWYEEDPTKAQRQLFDANNDDRYTRRDGISDKALAMFRDRYRDYSITKEEVFYYIYGVLSSPEYREKFGDDVKKVLARVPFAKDFRIFSEAGRKLGNLHVNYENVKAWPVKLIETPLSPGTKDKMHRVEKMRIIESNGEKIIRYNENITITEIPSETWEYIVNGKSALEWIIERYQDSTDKNSGLRNDCNTWGIEHSNPRYVLDLIESVIRVSVESVKIMKSLPELGI